MNFKAGTRVVLREPIYNISRMTVGTALGFNFSERSGTNYDVLNHQGVDFGRVIKDQEGYVTNGLIGELPQPTGMWVAFGNLEEVSPLMLDLYTYIDRELSHD